MKVIGFKLHSLNGLYEKVLLDYNKCLIEINNKKSKYYLGYITDIYESED